MIQHFDQSYKLSPIQPISTKPIQKQTYLEYVKDNCTALVCNVCSKPFNTARSKRRHMQITHSEGKPFQCPDCGVNFKAQNYLARHMRRSACGTRLKEPTMDYLAPSSPQSSDIRTVKMEINSESSSGLINLKPVNEEKTCPVCGKELQSNYNVRRHMEQVHITGKLFTCPKCGNGFNNKAYMMKHISRTQCGDKFDSSTEVALRAEGSSLKPRTDTENLLVEAPRLPGASPAMQELHRPW
jgi:uncharacterized Zn-finger protein